MQYTLIQLNGIINAVGTLRPYSRYIDKAYDSLVLANGWLAQIISTDIEVVDIGVDTQVWNNSWDGLGHKGQAELIITRLKSAQQSVKKNLLLTTDTHRTNELIAYLSAQKNSLAADSINDTNDSYLVFYNANVRIVEALIWLNLEL